MKVMIMLGKKLGIYLCAIAVSYVLAVTSATQHVVASLASMGIAVTASERISMTAHDLAGMAAMFVPMIAFGLLVAFLATALIYHLANRWQTALYALAGFCALVCIHVLLNLAFGLTPVAIARSSGGLLIQGLAGAAGGWVYITLNRRLGFSRGAVEIPP